MMPQNIVANPFRNPVLPGFYPDPSICRVGEDYFLVTSSFEYFPGVPLFHSRDLVHWRQIGHVLTRPNQLSFPRWRPSGGIYAPTIREHDGTFYMVTTNVGGGNFFVHTRDPFGEWSDPVWIAQSGIDPSLFFDDDGRVYLSNMEEFHFPLPEEIDLANPFWAIQQSEIDLTTGTLLTEPRRIWEGTGVRFPEAPHLYKIDGRYYLVIAEGGTDQNHMATIARSDSPWGPWESCPHNPILTHRSHHSPFQSLGHTDLVEAHDGSWWLVCLGVRPKGSFPPTTHLGRETFLAPVQWDADGWPHVGEQGKLPVEMERPALAPVAWEPEPERDDFSSPRLGMQWIFLGTPREASWSLTDRPGALRLLGNEARLDDGPPVAFVGRRQQHFSCDVATALDFDPQGEEEAGLTVWINPGHHYDLFVTRAGGVRIVAVRRRIGSLVAVVASEPLSDGPVVLAIQASLNSYSFAFTGSDGTQHTLATGETRYLAPQVAGGFTGVCFAMYTSGNASPDAAPAFFDWFDYTPSDG